MHRRNWPEIVKAITRDDLSIDVCFEDGKIVNLSMYEMRKRFSVSGELLTDRFFTLYQVLPHALLWESRPGTDGVLIEEVEINGGDIYHGIFETQRMERE